MSITETGQILVHVEPSPGNAHAMLWRQGEQPVTVLGSVVPYDMNSRLQIVGSTRYPDDLAHAYVFDPSTSVLTDLSVPGELYSEARAINSSGLVAGWFSMDGFTSPAFVWSAEGGRTVVDAFGGESTIPCDVNESGQVVGTGELGEYMSHGFVWSRGSGLTEIGDLGGGWSCAKAINDRGEVVGYSGIDMDRQGMFLWNPVDGMRCVLELPRTVWIEMFAINDSNVVVGTMLDTRVTEAVSQAFVWTPERGLTIIGVGGALDVNERGDIVGESYGQAVLWELVPEPSSLMVLGIGILPLARAFARRRVRSWI